MTGAAAVGEGQQSGVKAVQMKGDVSVGEQEGGGEKEEREGQGAVGEMGERTPSRVGVGRSEGVTKGGAVIAAVGVMSCSRAQGRGTGDGARAVMAGVCCDCACLSLNACGLAAFAHM